MGGEAKSVDFEKRAGEILSEGYLALGSGKAPDRVFAKVSCFSLMGCMDKKSPNFKPYFVKADNTSCKYWPAEVLTK